MLKGMQEVLERLAFLSAFYFFVCDTILNHWTISSHTPHAKLTFSFESKVTELAHEGSEICVCANMLLQHAWFLTPDSTFLADIFPSSSPPHINIIFVGFVATKTKSFACGNDIAKVVQLHKSLLFIIHAMSTSLVTVIHVTMGIYQSRFTSSTEVWTTSKYTAVPLRQHLQTPAASTTRDKVGRCSEIPSPAGFTSNSHNIQTFMLRQCWFYPGILLANTTMGATTSRTAAIQETAHQHLLKGNKSRSSGKAGKSMANSI